jgi:nucleoside-diphosphate-sugar epimerase
VLVTGASGCLGRHVVPLLVERGWDVHGLARREAPRDLETVTWHRADLLDPAQLGRAVAALRASHLLHLAWYIAPGRWAASPENFEWVTASLALVRAFHDAGGERVVTAGSCLEYDWSYGFCSEARTPCAPRTAYGLCKHTLERLTSAFCDATGSMTSAWGRIFFLYGPHEHPDRLVASVIRSILAGEPARASHGRQVRDYTFVGDIAEAFVELLERDVTGAVNIASGMPVALKDIVEQIGRMMGRPDLIRLGAIPPAPTDVPVVLADTERMSEQLTWRPHTDLEMGLGRTIAWWRQRIERMEMSSWG